MGRSPCCDKNGLKKGPWTPEEDHKLIDYIQKHGYGNWRTLPKNAGLARCGKSCRLRWTNYLRPDIKRGRFSSEEDEMIIQLHSILGNKWSAIAARLPGRTDNEIKNYWNTHIRKRLLGMGLDPVTHTPRLDHLLQLSSLLSSSAYNPAAHLQHLPSRFVGLEPLALNSELLRNMAANLLSSTHHQCQDQLLEAQVQFPAGTHPRVQDQLTSFQAAQGGAQEFSPPCRSISSSHDLFDEAQLMQANMGQLQQGAPTNLLQDMASFATSTGGLANLISDKLFNLGDHAINNDYNRDAVIYDDIFIKSHNSELLVNLLEQQ